MPAGPRRERFARETWRARLAQEIATLQTWPWLDTLRTLRQRFRDDHLGLTAGSLTFTTLISLVPLFTVMLAIFSAFPVFASFQDALQRYFLQSLVPPTIAKPVLAGLTQFAAQSSRLGTAGLIVLVLTALALMLTIDRTLNAVWRVRTPRPIAQRVFVYWAAATLGPLLLGVSLSITSYALSASQGLVRVLPGGVSLLLGVLEFGLVAAGIAALFRWVPNTHVRWRHAATGGLFVAAGLEVAKRALGWYLAQVPTYSVVYGAFAAVPIFLVWIYLGWVIVLLGAVIAAYTPSLQMRVQRWPDGPGAGFRLSVAVLRELAVARDRPTRGLTAGGVGMALRADPLQTGPIYGYGALLDLPSATPPRSAVVVAAQAGLQASAAGLVRGTLILSVDGVDLVNDSTDAGVDVLNAGLFPSGASTHTFTVLDPGATSARSVTLTASAVTDTPVSNVKTLPAPNQSVGYLEFDAHIATAEGLLIKAIDQLKTAGITDLVLDLRYNGGGYLDIASELAYMIAGPTPTAGRAFDTVTFNDKNPFKVTAAQATTPFHTTAQGFSAASGQPLPWLGLGRVFVIATGGTCSASEAVINGLRGVGVEVVLIGGTTCGKPYGFFPQDNCSTTYFSIQFQSVNALGFGDYADGFTPTCAGNDDYAHALGDPAEGLLASALARRETGACPAVSASGTSRVQAASGRVPAGPALRRPPSQVNRIYRGA